MAYTIEQHQQALEKAQAAGDEAAVARISQKIRDAHAGAYDKATEAGDIDAAERIATKYREARGDTWSRESANSDPVWVKNAKTLYQEVEKKPFEGDDATAAEWLKGYMSDFNYRLLGSEKLGLRNTIGISQDVKNFSPKGKAAFLTAMDDFDALPTFSGEGFVEAGKRVLTDPSTLVGIGGLGGGEAAVQGAKQAAKMGVKALIKAGTKKALTSAATSAAEGAVYAGAQDAARQNAEINAGREDEFDPMRTAKAAGTGALVAGAPALVVGGGRAVINRELHDVTAQAADKVRKNADTAAMEAEHVLDLKAQRDAPTNLRQHVTVSDANAVSKNYKDSAVALAQRAKLNRTVKEKIQDAVRNPRATTEAQLDDLAMSSPEGAAVAQAVRKSKVANAVTARGETEDNVVKRTIRHGVDYLPIPPVLARTIQHVLRAPTRTEHINSRVLSKKSVKVAEEVLKQTGPSSATTGMDNLEGIVAASRRKAAVKPPPQTGGTINININNAGDGLGNIPDPERIRMRSQYAFHTREIQGMQNRVLEDAAMLPEGSPLRGAMEDYIRVLDTSAKRNPAARQKAYEDVTRHLSPEDKAHFDAHPDIKKLHLRFKEKLTAEEAERRGAARKEP